MYQKALGSLIRDERECVEFVAHSQPISGRLVASWQSQGRGEMCCCAQICLARVVERGARGQSLVFGELNCSLEKQLGTPVGHQGEEQGKLALLSAVGQILAKSRKVSCALEHQTPGSDRCQGANPVVATEAITLLYCCICCCPAVTSFVGLSYCTEGLLCHVLTHLGVPT